MLKGESEAALAAFVEENGDLEYRDLGSALALYSLGRQAEFESAVTEFQEKWGARCPGDVATVYAWKGDVDTAFVWLEKERQVKGNFGGYPYDPLLRSLHDDPRWLPLLEKAGASPVQLDAIEFKVTLPE
jgi:hypothetical protein